MMDFMNLPPALAISSAIVIQHGHHAPDLFIEALLVTALNAIRVQENCTLEDARERLAARVRALGQRATH